MPSWLDYGLQQNDVGDIVNYIRSLNKNAPAAAANMTARNDGSTRATSETAQWAGTRNENHRGNPMATQPAISSRLPRKRGIHQDITVKWFLLGSVAYFAIVGVIALIIAAKFVWPQFLGTIPYFTYGRMRPLHVNGMLFGWLLAADMGLAYYYCTSSLRRKTVERETGHCHLGPLEHHHSQRHRNPARGIPEGSGVCRPAHSDCRSGCHRVGDVRHQYFRHHRSRASTNRCMCRHGI